MGSVDTVALLCEWGKWSRDARNSLGAKSASLIVMRLVQPARMSSDPDICDDDALRVDRAASQLKRYDSKMYEIIELYFLHCLSMREIESRMRLKKTEAVQLFAKSCGWLDCLLNVNSQAA